MTVFIPIRSLFRRLSPCITGLLLGLCLSSPATLGQGLPELSDSAALIMNSEQEKMFGQQVMLSIRAQGNFSSDRLLLDYFTRLALDLVRHSPRDFGRPKVSLAIDPAINAFALPGGYITVNTGLIQNTRSEGELASVVAHEIGHQSQRHISRSIERQKQLTLPATAALLGGLIIGGEAGKAAMVTSQAAVASDQLSYSRTFEREADATGMNIMAAAGYDPDAMPSFFGKLEEQSRLYGGLVLEFLSTHPVSTDRIADGRSRARNITAGPPPQAPPADRLDYAHAEARTLALYDTPLDRVIEHFKLASNNAQPNSTAHHVASYGLGLAYTRNNQFDRAASTLSELRQAAPDNPVYTLAEAELVRAKGDHPLAIEQFESLYRQDTSHPAYIDGYARSLIQSENYAAAVRVLRKVIRHHPEMNWAYGLLARAYGDDGQMLNAVFTRAQYFESLGLYKQALEMLHQHQGRAYPDSSEYLTASIGSLIKRLEEKRRQLDNFKL